MAGKSQIYKQGYEPWKGPRAPEEATDRLMRHPAMLIGRMSLKNTTFMPSGCLLRLASIIFIGFPIAAYYFVVIVSSIFRFQIESFEKSELFNDLAQFFTELATQADFGAREADVHMNFILWPSLLFSIFAMIFYGSQLISREKQANALQVYFAKALDRRDYVLGKFFVLGVINALFTLVPSALMILLGLTLSPDLLGFIREAWYVPIMTGAYWLTLTLVMGGIALACSSMFNRFYLAAVGFIGFSIFCSAASALLSILFGAPAMLEGMDWTRGVYSMGRAIFTGEVGSRSLFVWQVIDLAIIVAVSLWLLFRNIRPVEVIK